MGDLLSPMHLLFIGILVVLLFGGKKLPELGKGLGEGLRGFKEGMKGLTDEEARVAAEQKARENEVVIK